MPDLNHLWGNDLVLSPSGDLATTDVPSLTEQRVLRRLLTSQGEYIWQLDYGASLSTYVGQPGAALAIEAAIRGQLSKEPAIARSPAPTIDLTPDPSGNLYVQIRYADAATGQTGIISFTS
jgi:phage baseplate assembly protein W